MLDAGGESWASKKVPRPSQREMSERYFGQTLSRQSLPELGFTPIHDFFWRGQRGRVCVPRMYDGKRTYLEIGRLDRGRFDVGGGITSTPYFFMTFLVSSHHFDGCLRNPSGRVRKGLIT